MKDNIVYFLLMTLISFAIFSGVFFRSYFFMKMNMRNSFIEALIFFLVAEAFVAYHAFMK